MEKKRKPMDKTKHADLSRMHDKRTCTGQRMSDVGESAGSSYTAVHLPLDGGDAIRRSHGRSLRGWSPPG